MTETQQSFVQRLIGAAKLDIDTYEEVEHDQDATGQAAAVVALVAVCAAIGGASDGQGGLISGAVGALIGWLIWSGVTYLIGTRLFKGEATWGELMRTIGFAQAPGVLVIFAGFGLIGALVAAISSIWTLVAGLIAIRQALDVGTGEALITAFLGWAAYMMVRIFAAVLLGVNAAVLKSLDFL